jgi:hypothetical protein
MRPGLSKKTIWSVNGAGGRGYCNRLVNLYRRGMILMRSLLMLLTFAMLSLALFSFHLGSFFLLRRIFHDLTFPVLSHLSLTVLVWLIRCRPVGRLLECL